jgi:hypothetical protein
MLATCLAHLALHGILTIVMLNEECYLQFSVLINFLHPAATALLAVRMLNVSTMVTVRFLCSHNGGFSLIVFSHLQI